MWEIAVSNLLSNCSVFKWTCLKVHCQKEKLIVKHVSKETSKNKQHWNHFRMTDCLASDNLDKTIGTNFFQRFYLINLAMRIKCILFLVKSVNI